MAFVNAISSVIQNNSKENYMLFLKRFLTALSEKDEACKKSDKNKRVLLFYSVLSKGE